MKAITWGPDENSWGWQSVLAEQHPSPPWTLLNISCRVRQSAAASSPNSVSLLESGPLIKRLDIVTTHGVYSTSLSLSLSVSLLLLTLKSHPRWHLLRNAGTSVEEDGGWGKAHYSRPASGWVTILHASCHANVHSCGLTHFPLIWQRSWAPPARPSCQPPIRLHFRSILIVHGLHSKSSSFTDKEAVSTRKVKLWWK